MILFSLCDIPFWLLWLLPLLFGLWAWWSTNNKYNNAVTSYEGKIKGLDAHVSGLQGNLTTSNNKIADLEGDLAMAKGRMREMEAEVKAMKDAAIKSGVSSTSDVAGGSGNSGSKGSGGTSSGAKVSGGSGDISSSLTGSEKSSTYGSTSSGGGSTGVSDTSSGGSKTSKYAKISTDNLQIIEGIGEKVEQALKDKGIHNINDLANSNTDDLRAILATNSNLSLIDPSTWVEQAKYGASGDWDGLIAYQKNLDAGSEDATGVTPSKLEKYLVKIGAVKAFKQDDLTAIEGIGPATDKLLRANGINSWRELAETSVERLNEILSSGGKFGLSQPDTWPKQAKMAADGDFDKLQEYQDFLDGGRE